MRSVRNILFIMCDQLRWDYLSCYGHPTLATPNIDKIAKLGVRFDRAYVQSPVCGPSRMSFYTGRTVFSHGATWNFVPLPIGERTIGDFLRPSGMRVAVVGKTHMAADEEGMAHFGLNRLSEIGIAVAQGGFEPFERDDGEPMPTSSARTYNDWLRSKGYVSDDPWNDFANSGVGPDGRAVSGWSMRNARYPARVKEEHSETAYITDRGLEFMAECGESPWLLHLSYIKPHWPFVAPEPYHNLFGAEAVLPGLRTEAERVNPHPVYDAFMQMDAAQSFSREDVRETVIPVYMGLIKQVDDHIGRVVRFLASSGRIKDTMIVFTSDHGDYLGDHWLGEKELFHEQSVRVPLIIYDPDHQADGSRGTVEHRLVEAIDLLPTFLGALNLEPQGQRLEGRSVLPLLRGESVTDWRKAVLSELDFSFYRARTTVGVDPTDARCYMIRTDRWKYVFHKKFRPQLFDLLEDPGEYEDLGGFGSHQAVLDEMQALLLERLMNRKNRVTVSDAAVVGRTDGTRAKGVFIGQW
jgi:arylsulfatase A-like enzyme